MIFTLEEHLEKICPCCKKEHKKQWKTHFSNEVAYSSISCACGYEIFKKEDFMTSGI